MQRKIILVGLAFVFLLTACGGGSKKAEPEDSAQAPIQAEVQAEAPEAAPVAEQQAPAEEVQDEGSEDSLVGGQQAPAEEVMEPTAEEEPTPEGFDFADDFDLDNDNFSEDYLLTTQAPNRDQVMTPESEVQDGFMMWKIRDKETYIYKFANDSSTEDVVIESKWVSKGTPLNGIALICRAAEDYSSWYEARISAAGDWQILLYDRSIREADEYKNPFVTLKKGVAKLKLVKPTSPNVSKFTCEGTKLTYEINGTELVSTSNNDLKGGGLVGLGVMSTDQLQAQIDFDYFYATAP